MTDQKTITLMSKLDPSVNVFENGFETRFVTRETENGDMDIIIYLSSFKGCDRACRMCWLTQQGQTDMTPATIQDFVRQAYTSVAKAQKYLLTSGKNVASVHFNFMARGEPLMNPVIRNDWFDLSNTLIMAAAQLCDRDDIEIKFKISTIMSDIYERDENGTIVGGMQKLPFEINLPEIYYSLYSVDPLFRKRWLPKAEEPAEALRILSNYSVRGGPVRFHSAFIEGHNDDMKDVLEVIKAINYYGLPKKFNIVRYNSPDIEKSQETPEEHLLEIKKFMESRGYEVQMVERVGSDIAASCGQFINERTFNHEPKDTAGVYQT